LEKVYLQKEIQGPLAKALQHNIKEHKIPVSYVPIEKLNKLSKSSNLLLDKNFKANYDNYINQRGLA
jgi:tRNA G18 (ribose-2'-O)-methylase SpoU